MKPYYEEPGNRLRQSVLRGQPMTPRPSSLPEWIENIKHCPDGPEHCSDCMKIPLLIQALSIAWEALQNGDRHMHFTDNHTHDKHDIDIFENAMCRIEALGEKEKA